MGRAQRNALAWKAPGDWRTPRRCRAPARGLGRAIHACPPMVALVASGLFRQDRPVNGFVSIWSERRRQALAAVGGLMMAAAFPKLNVAGLAWVAPGVILWAALGARSPFRVGCMGGLAFYLAALHWLVFIPVTFYPILGWLALGAYLALLPATWCWICAKTFSGESWWRCQVWAWFGAVVWVALEMVQARLFSGMPWTPLGVSQHRFLPLIQIASFTSVYGVSFLVVWFSLALMLSLRGLLREPTNRLAWLSNLVLPMFAVAAVWCFGLTATMGRPIASQRIKVALVQPSIPQQMIWSDDASAERFQAVLKLSTLAQATKPQLLIWPEAAVPSLPRWDTNLWRSITNHVVAGGVWLIMGADDVVPRSPTEEDWFNSSFLISPRGEMVASYHKRRLVIFGEYIPLVHWLPFMKWLTPIGSGFAEGDRVVPFVIPELGVRTATLICFEDIFPHYVREYVAPDTDFLVNITNDGWFRESAAHWQQAANAAFRSVENRVPLVRCANNGLSCWIDETGAMHEVWFGDSKNIYAPGVKTAQIPLLGGAKREPTFYNRHGDWFGWSCVALTAAFLVFHLSSVILRRTQAAAKG